MLVDYRKLDTFWHKLNPKVMVMYVLFMIVASIVWTDPFYCIGITAVTTLVAFSAKFPWKKIGWFLKLALSASIIIIIIQALTLDESLIEQEIYKNKVLFYLLPGQRLPFSLGGLLYGFAASLKIYMVVFAIGVMGFCVPPSDLVQLLSRTRLASRQFIFIFSTAWRFIPIIQAQAFQLIDAQKTRGMELEKGRLMERLKKMASIVTPLLANSLEIGTQIALTMEARAFGSKKKTKFLKPLVMDARAKLMFWGFVLLTAGLIAMGILGIGIM